MKRFEIVNGMRRYMEPCAVFVWDDDSISFSIDIDESSTEKMSLCCSSHFLRMGQRHIEDAWVGRWVGGRIVPSDGQKCCGRTGFNSTIRCCCCSSQVGVGAPRMISLSRGEGCGCFRIGLESCWEYSASSSRAGGNKPGGVCRRMRHASTNAQSNRTRRNEPHRRNA